MDLSVERWEGITSTERHAVAKRLAMELPSGFAFDSIRRFRLGERQHNIALYRNDNASFALIPGGKVSLGFKASGWTPNNDESESWRETSEEYGLQMSMRDHVDEVTLPVCSVELKPLLIETVAVEVGWKALRTGDPQVQRLLSDHGTLPGHTLLSSRGPVSVRVHIDADGLISAEQSLSPSPSDLDVQLRASGFRFPTSHEWEYACGSGATTLFRWGDHVPCDRYPTDVSPAEAAWRLRWALSRGKLKRPPGGFKSDWGYHRQPNAFGLTIASDPYKRELVAELNITRGGDGGTTICGGAGFFVGWLTLATAYFEDHSCTQDPAAPISPGHTIGRRVLELG